MAAWTYKEFAVRVEQTPTPDYHSARAIPLFSIWIQKTALFGPKKKLWAET
jgi:hypothetical protein